VISSSASRESRNEKLSARSLTTVSPRDWLRIGAAGISGALSWLFYFLTLQTGRTVVVATDRPSVVLVVLLAAVFLGESLTWRALLGAGCMVVGALLLIR
jgi:transporter family protein